MLFPGRKVTTAGRTPGSDEERFADRAWQEIEPLLPEYGQSAEVHGATVALSGEQHSLKGESRITLVRAPGGLRSLADPLRPRGPAAGAM